MTPVIKHLHKLFMRVPRYIEPSSNTWIFAKQLEELGPDFYSQLLPLHPSLNLEYSTVCTQLRHTLLANPIELPRQQLIDQLTNALVLAQLLEHLHLHYLLVPRDVVRLRNQQQTYQQLLTQLNAYTFIAAPIPAQIKAGLSFSQRLREHTTMANWYRMITARSKRVLNFLDQVGTGWPGFSDSVALIDKYANPVLAHLAWFFFLPRLLVNTYLLLKHTVAGSWMKDKEASISWTLRLQAQLQRRWFELANDVLWFVLGFVNCFFFFGPLASIGVCLNLVGFVLDIVISGARVYIELNRLKDLFKAYEQLANDPAIDPIERKAIREHQAYIARRTQFEQLRLYLHLANTCAVFLAMCLAIPVLIVNPMFPLIGAILLVAIWGMSFTLTRKLEEYRPSEVIEPIAMARLPNEPATVSDNQAPALAADSDAVEHVESPSYDTYSHASNSSSFFKKPTQSPRVTSGSDIQNQALDSTSTGQNPF